MREYDGEEVIIFCRPLNEKGYKLLSMVENGVDGETYKNHFSGQYVEAVYIHERQSMMVDEEDEHLCQVEFNGHSYDIPGECCDVFGLKKTEGQ